MIVCKICGVVLEGSVGNLARHMGEFHKGKMGDYRRGHFNKEPINKWCDIKETEIAIYEWRK